MDNKTDPSLSVDEMIKKLQELSNKGMGSHVLKIKYDSASDSIGATPCVNISELEPGIDWDTSKVFLSTIKKLGITDEQLKEDYRSLQNGVGMLLYNIRKISRDSLFTPDQTLSQINELVDNYINRKPKDDNTKIKSSNKPRLSH